MRICSQHALNTSMCNLMHFIAQNIITVLLHEPHYAFMSADNLSVACNSLNEINLTGG